MINRRNFRFRHPITAETLNKIFDEILEQIIYFIGIHNNKTEKNGIIIERVSSATTTTSADLEISDFVELKYHIRRFIRR